MIKRHLPSRKTWPFAALAVVCVAALVGVLTSGIRPLSAAQFAQTGHWVYNSVLRSVFHIDGGTTNIDAQVDVDGEPGSQVVQSDTHGYVVGPGRITVFDKAVLAVQQVIAPPVSEVPLAIEVLGGPYLVYRNAGTIVRLGDPTARVTVGGTVGDPVVTDDGTMWLHRKGSGQICTLPKDAVSLTGCPVTAPKDHEGAMTIVDGRPAFVDLFTSTVHMIDGNTLGAGIPLGVPVSANSRPATHDLGGRLAILDPQRHVLVLVDTKAPNSKPQTVALEPGAYDGPVSTGDVLALVNRQTGTVITYGADGAIKDTKPIKQKEGTPRLSRGEDDRVYVEDAEGTQVLVVAKDGHVQDVDVAGKSTATTPTPAPGPTQTTDARVGQPTGPPNGQPDKPRGPVEQPPRATPPPPIPPSRPGAPPSVAAQAANASATITWGTAADNRAAITSYRVSWRAATGATGSVTVSGGVLRTTVNGLANGVRYVFTVTAINRVGAGPGVASNPVTPNSPVSPAAAPVNLRANYDEDDRPTRDVTLTWGQPALNGGTLVHYAVTGTGLAARTVTGTTTTYPQLNADTVYTFTVRAVTRTPDGQTLNGQPVSATHRDTPRTPTVTVTRGKTERYNETCEVPECGEMRVVMRGFEPHTRYEIVPFSDSDSDYENPGSGQTTDANGNRTFEAFHFGDVGAMVWVVVDGKYQSKKYRWVSG